jgi:hypothetical protein
VVATKKKAASKKAPSKKAPSKKAKRTGSRSGPNIPDSQRNTRRVTVHVAPHTESRWRALARDNDETLSEVAMKAIDLLDAVTKRAGS